MNYSAKDAKNTIIFIINEYHEIEETTLYEHVMQSADKTTSPRGIMTRLFFEPMQVDVVNEETGEDEEVIFWQLKSWGMAGRGRAKVIGTFNTCEEAEDAFYTGIYKYDFARDDQRDTTFWYSKNEAIVALTERL